jgi:isopenicillin N synthase-like dioxygenase
MAPGLLQPESSPSLHEDHSPSFQEIFPDLPPFPTDVPIAPLIRLSLAKLRRDDKESARFFEASKNLGFFYLDLRNDEAGERLLDEADKLFKVGKELFELGREELNKYDYKAQGVYYGYKGFGNGVTDDKGTLDRNEFYNVSSDSGLMVSLPNKVGI